MGRRLYGKYFFCGSCVFSVSSMVFVYWDSRTEELRRTATVRKRLDAWKNEQQLKNMVCLHLFHFQFSGCPQFHLIYDYQPIYPIDGKRRIVWYSENFNTWIGSGNNSKISQYRPKLSKIYQLQTMRWQTKIKNFVTM